MRALTVATPTRAADTMLLLAVRPTPLAPAAEASAAADSMAAVVVVDSTAVAVVTGN